MSGIGLLPCQLAGSPPQSFAPAWTSAVVQGAVLIQSAHPGPTFWPERFLPALVQLSISCCRVMWPQAPKRGHVRVSVCSAGSPNRPAQAQSSLSPADSPAGNRVSPACATPGLALTLCHPGLCFHAISAQAKNCFYVFNGCIKVKRIVFCDT